jgi:hypothetical protein
MTSSYQQYTFIDQNSLEPPKLNLSSDMEMHILKHIVTESNLAMAQEKKKQEKKKQGVRKKHC